MDIVSLLDDKNKIPAEETFDRFVKNFGGKKISDFLPGDPTFQNADYLFPKEKVFAELKTLQTDFGVKDSFRKKQIELAKTYIIFHKERCPLVQFSIVMSNQKTM